MEGTEPVSSMKQHDTPTSSSSSRQMRRSRRPATTLDSFEYTAAGAVLKAAAMAKPASTPPLRYGKTYDYRLDPKSTAQHAAIRHIGKARVDYRNELHYVVENKKGKLIHDVTRTELGWQCVCPAFAEDKNCSGVETARFATMANMKARPTLHKSLPVPEGPICPRCGSEVAGKSGFRETKRGDVQRYVCRQCGKRYTEMGVLSHLRVQPDLVVQAVDQHFKGLSYKQVAQNISLLGTKVTKSTIERWVSKVSELMADLESELEPSLGAVWHADETTIYAHNGKTLAGRKESEAYAWNFMDHKTRYWLGCLVTKGRSGKEGRKAAKEAKENAKDLPDMLVTDGFYAYNEVSRREFATLTRNALHVIDPPINGLAKPGEHNFPHMSNQMMERLQETQRAYTKPMGEFRSLDSANRRLNGFRTYYNLVREHEGLDGLTPAEAAGLHVAANPGQSRFEAVLMAARMAGMRRAIIDRYNGAA